MGMVFQHYAVWPHMTVFDNVAFGLTARSIKRDEVHRRTVAMQIGPEEKSGHVRVSGGFLPSEFVVPEVGRLLEFLELASLEART